MKRFFSLIFAVLLMATLVPTVNATNSDTTHYEIVTREEYIQNYADMHNISYKEAEAIDCEDNIRIWNEYCMRNNLPQPRTIIWQDYYAQADAKIWYIIVQATTDEIPHITYGSHGKLIADAHSKTFVKDSFTTPFVYTNNSVFSTGSHSLNIQCNYDHVFLSLVCPVEIPYNLAGTVGGKAHLVELGFELSGTAHLRKTIYDSHTEWL